MADTKPEVDCIAPNLGEQSKNSNGYPTFSIMASSPKSLATSRITPCLIHYICNASVSSYNNELNCELFVKFEHQTHWWFMAAECNGSTLIVLHRMWRPQKPIIWRSNWISLLYQRIVITTSGFAVAASRVKIGRIGLELCIHNSCQSVLHRIWHPQKPIFYPRIGFYRP